MKFYDEEARKKWESTKKINEDEYGKIIIEYAESCMNLLEQRMSEGVGLEDIWQNTLFEVEGAKNQSSYSASLAHNLIASCWVHGEEFARRATKIYEHYSNPDWQKFFCERRPTTDATLDIYGEGE
ncbi:TPA: hypothetical protein PNM99_002389 [Listeria monocytogenes]|nr:hypothetical protein [Listeria monocytogenes]